MGAKDELSSSQQETPPLRLTENPVADTSDMPAEPTPSHSAPSSTSLDQPSEELDSDEMFGVFSSRTPQHVGSGISSGLKNVGKGVLLGIGSLIYLPAQNYKDHGISKVPQGVVLGALACAGAVTTGTVTGLKQVCRGVYNTPSAVSEKISGRRRWDIRKREWVKDNLEEERKIFEKLTDDEDILSEGRKACKKLQHQSSPQPQLKVANTEYYECLGVPTNATSDQIKRAYYKKATLVHPDKCPGPESTAKFQKLSQAYAVLSDPEKRKQYNATGEANKETFNNLDLFNMAFSVEKFHPLIGQYEFTFYFTEEIVLTSKQSSELQRRREIRIALHLADLLDPFVKGNKEDFEAEIKKIATDLCQTSFGDLLVKIIGREYILNAAKGLGIFSSAMSTAQSTFNDLKSLTHGSVSAGKLILASRKNDSDSLDNLALLSNLVGIGETAIRADVKKVLARATERLFYDSVPTDVIEARVNGLQLMGEIFIEIAQHSSQAAGYTSAERLMNAFSGGNVPH